MLALRLSIPVLVLVLGGCLLGIGCQASQSAAGPHETLGAYAQALDAGRVEEAYAMLSDEAKREMSLEAFRRVVRENPAEVHEIVRALSRPAGPARVTATISTPQGESLLLVYESGRWKIDSSAVNLYAQTTPRQAVSSFVRAFERKRYDLLMRFVPEDKVKDGLTEQKLKDAWEGPQKDDIQRIVQAVKSAMPTSTFEEVGDRATMPFGAVGTVQLVREHGMWKIEDFD